MEQIECYETLAYKIQTPGNYPEEKVQHTEHGESLKSRIRHSSFPTFTSCYISHPLSLINLQEPAQRGNGYRGFGLDYYHGQSCKEERLAIGGGDITKCGGRGSITGRRVRYQKCLFVTSYTSNVKEYPLVQNY
jgi:hypothetical protein